MSDSNISFAAMPQTQTETFKKLFPGYHEGLVRSDPGGFVMSPLYAKNAEKIYHMKPRPDDVWLITFPKCGNNFIIQIQKGILRRWYSNCRNYLDIRITLASQKRLRHGNSCQDSARWPGTFPRVNISNDTMVKK